MRLFSSLTCTAFLYMSATMHMITGTMSSVNPIFICLVPSTRCMLPMQSNVMNEAAARLNNIPTFFRGNKVPFFWALMELNRKARRRAKQVIAPMSLSAIIETCIPLNPSIHTICCWWGFPLKKPIVWAMMTPRAMRPRKMTAPVSHLRDFVEFFFIIDKYLLFFDMQI